MKITNNSHLPEPLYRAICADTYSKGDSDITTTQLALPSRIWALRKLHYDNIVEDAEDRIYSALGQSIHLLLERLASDPAYIVERRYYADVCGMKLGGQIDLLVKATRQIHDWKLTSTYVHNSGAKFEWTIQANVNRWLMAQNDEPADSAVYIAIYRDWSKKKASRSMDYPQVGVGQFALPLWPLENVKPFIEKRITSHTNALTALPECSQEDRWAKPEKWAHMRKGRKSAVRLYNTKEEADNATAADPKGLHVEHRPSEDTRCVDWCSVAPFCEYAKQRGYV
jgi:hypothetical protein